MKTTQAIQLAKALMSEHNLIDWKLELTNTKRVLGVCCYGKKTIQLSRNMIQLNDEQEVKKTILHEIAHALVGNGKGHSWIWKEKCISIGGDGERCSTIAKVPEGKRVYECPNCKQELHYHRKLKRRTACRRCCEKYNNGIFTDRFLLRLK